MADHHQPLLPSFRAQLASYGLRRAAVRARAHTLSCLEALCGPALAPVALTSAPFGRNSRERHFPLARVFWCFLWQALNPETSCREVVRQLQALLSLEGLGKISSKTGAYCRARARLPLALLQSALHHTSQAAGRRAGAFCIPGLNREVVVVDGSSTTAADTRANQRRFPQSRSQAPGCGFPWVRFLVFFNLASGAIMDVAIGNKHAHELRLFRQIWDRLKPGVILLADRGFSDYCSMAHLLGRGIDMVTRLHQARDPDARVGRRLGSGDRLRTFTKPLVKPTSLLQRIWKSLPKELTVRLITLKVSRKGFRPARITLATTLLDEKAYPRQMIEELYLHRWRLELCLKDIKTTMKMESLRAQSPEMIEKEIYAFLTAYNLIRWVMADVKCQHQVALDRISFKGSVDAVRQFSAALGAAGTGKRRRRLYATLLESIGTDLVPLRPGRQEPRAVKRRPKPFALLNKHRHIYKDKGHRNK